MPASTRAPRIRPVLVGRILRALAAAECPRPGQFIVTQWSESCVCGGNFLGHQEEPCRPDCTGYHPVRGYHVLGHGGGPQAAGQPGDSYGPTQAT
ncbi:MULTISPECIES: hypothetical protein [unclassified Streptomyces]|uniref:hypothetical protein n=1 Tax=unclassified Streptomyces TaxID=2593676 RepID=UPI0004CC2957|nr:MULTISPECIES: hypothetical protein [unclassified Streptomyces]KOV94616.1 hypothetical protein ADL02_09710 [Streptomyces sp. NRRL WC-3723]